MPPKIVLVGHCGADNAYLKITVSKAVKEAHVVAADDEAELQQLIAGGVDLLLLNREMPYGFPDAQGVDLIRRLRQTSPSLKMMLVSNYADAQQAAVAAGALPGFGKRELGRPHVVELLKGALKA